MYGDMLDVSEGAAPPLGKKQENLLAAILRGVPVLGHDNEARPLAEEEARRLLRAAPAPAFPPSAEETAELNRTRPRVLHAVVGPEARRTGYVHGLPRHGVPPLLRAAGAAARAPLVLRVVYGASTQVPLRALSYVLPAVRMAARLAGSGHRDCHVQVVLAGPLSGRLNALGEETVAEQTELLAHCLQRLLSFLGPVAHSVYRASAPPRVLGALTDLVAALPPDRRARILCRLEGKGGARHEEQTLLYAAAHVLVHDRTDDRTHVPLTLRHGTPAPAHPAVIDVGSLQERHFHDVRRWFARATGADDPGSLVLTRHSVPPYTMARGGDLALRDFLDGRHHEDDPLAAAARHDLRHLWDLLPPGPLRQLLDAPVGAAR